jgi:CheY-like chemotaxis protein
MDGFKATARIRKLERQLGEQSGAATPHIPILALTASATAEYHRKCADQGMDDFLSKVRFDPLPTTLLSSVAANPVWCSR